MFELLQEDDRLVAVRRTDPDDPEIYEVVTDICASPVCGCREVAMELTPASPAARAVTPQGPLRVRVDPARCAAVEDTAPEPQARLADSHAFAAELSQDGWKYLYGYFRQVKARAIESMDPASIGADVEFEYDSIEREGVLVGYNDALPFAPDILVSAGERTHVLDDQYCVKPSCHCAKTVVSFYAIPEHGTGSGPPACVLTCDYRARTWTDSDTRGPITRDARALRDALLAQHPDVLETIASRHRLMRALYRGWLAAHRAALSSKVGRNDPCPCGSGKKYKRCCGGA